MRYPKDSLAWFSALLGPRVLTVFFLSLVAAPLSSANNNFPLSSQGNRPNFLFEHDSKALATLVQFTVRTGSLADPKGKEGLAMLAFQSLLRGTMSKDRSVFFAELERLGATLSVDVGASRTNIVLEVVSENLQPALALMAEAILNPGLKAEAIDGLKREELAQLAQEQGNNRSVLRRAFRRALFRGTTLEIPPDGIPESLAEVSVEDIKKFLEAHIQFGQIVFSAASNLPENEMRQMFTTAFHAIPQGKAPGFAVPKLKNPSGRWLYLVERPGSSVTELLIGHSGIKANERDRPLLELANFSLGEDMSSRLFQTLRAKHGWTYGAYSSFQMIDLPRSFGGSFLLYTFPQAEHTAVAGAKALEIYEEFVKSGLTKEELEFARQSLGNSYPFKLATSRSRLLARLYNTLDGAPVHTVSAYRGQLKGISQTGLRRAIRRHQQTKDLVIVAVGDPARLEELKKKIPNLKGVVRVSDPMARAFP
jgi:zinc protease